MNSRLIATRILYDVFIEKHSLSDALTKHLSGSLESRDKSFIQSLCYGVCRWMLRLDFILSKLLEKPLKQKDADIKIVLWVGLYQLIFMRVAPHAAVTETVAVTKALKKIWAKGLVNAILRSYLRQQTGEDSASYHHQILAFNELPDAGMDLLKAEFSHPEWFIEKLQQQYPPDAWSVILQANNQHPPFSLRVNLAKLSRENYSEKLNMLGLQHRIISDTVAGLTLDQPIEVAQVPGFLLGDVSVQDGSAQLAAELLELTPHLAVLDACAAPGGKLNAMLERQPSLRCTAIELDAGRLKKIQENLTRLHQKAHLILADAANIETWWSGELFDRILLDAPCSATGVIRRHPDIKWLRQEEDIAKLAAEQLRLLSQLWKTLKAGGVLLYATCSVLVEENDLVIEKFLALHPEAKVDTLPLPIGIFRQCGRQILPGLEDMDGFYYARLRK